MKTRFKPRELLWMTFPIVLLGSGSILYSLRQQILGTSPETLEQGTPRLELRNWKRLEPRAVDQARGLSARVVVDAWGAGQSTEFPGSPRMGSFNNEQSSLRFAFLRHGQWRSQPIHSASSGMDFCVYPQSNPLGRVEQNKTFPLTGHLELHLPIDQVPHDATEVRLRGNITGYFLLKGKPMLHPIQSPPIDVLLKAPEENWPVIKAASLPHVQFVGATQEVVRGNYSSLQSVKVRASFKTEPGMSLTSAACWIEDANRKFVLKVGEPDLSNVPLTYLTWYFLSIDVKGQGPFMLKSWVYCSPDEQPMLIKIPLDIKTIKQSR